MPRQGNSWLKIWALSVPDCEQGPGAHIAGVESKSRQFQQAEYILHCSWRLSDKAWKGINITVFVVDKIILVAVDTVLGAGETVLGASQTVCGADKAVFLQL